MLIAVQCQSLTSSSDQQQAYHSPIPTTLTGDNSSDDILVATNLGGDPNTLQDDFILLY